MVAHEIFLGFAHLLPVPGPHDLLAPRFGAGARTTIVLSGKDPAFTRLRVLLEGAIVHCTCEN